MQKNTVIAVVVTYNRLDLLKDLINSLRNQTFQVSQILVVNNGSTDDTALWLNSQADIKVVSQGNSGSSGGQYRSIKTALEFDYEWIWVMDDDILHDNQALETMMKFATQTSGIPRVFTTLRYTNKDQVFYNDTISYNLSNPFKSFWTKILDKKTLEESGELIQATGITFEGPLLHRNVVEKVGLPIYDFFIYGDDTEYFLRIEKAGFPINIVKKAKTIRRLGYIIDSKNEKGKLVFTWKHYYIIRNTIIINLLYGNIFVKTFRPVAYLLMWLLRTSNFNDMKVVCKAFIDALRFTDVPPES